MVFLTDILPDTNSHLSEWLKSKTPNAGKDAKQQESSLTADGHANWCSHFEDSFTASYKAEHRPTIQPSNHTPNYLHNWVENVCPLKNLHRECL